MSRRNFGVPWKSTADPRLTLDSTKYAAASKSSPALPSTSATLSSPRDCVEEFFKYRPQRLKPGEGDATRSTGTRAPASFDKHLHDILKLRYVVRLPSITSDLLDVAQKALDAYPNLPVVGENFPTKDNHDRSLELAPDHIMSEKDVELFYLLTTGSYCPTVAATLALKLPNWSSGCISYTLGQTFSRKDTEGVTKVNRRQAVADGFLNFTKVTKADIKRKSLGLSPVHVTIHDRFPVLVPWEFKNINFSEKRTTLDAVVTSFLDSQFPWEGCEHGQYCSSEHDTGFTAAPMGYDDVLAHPYMGQSLEELVHEQTGSRQFVSKEQIMLFRKALEKIHKANYLHGNLTAKSLMFKGGKNSLKLSFLGFADAKRLSRPPVKRGDHRNDDDTDTFLAVQRRSLMKKESEDLIRSVLNPPLKRTMDGLDSLPNTSSITDQRWRTRSEKRAEELRRFGSSHI
ncbi:hypothetical protein D9615_008033 [Tricholomella constricta]|uniref:Protein kinase domain-containing protein n=1 Tax=Tricholomella constricta TaxID=117010 RepID=A0A8H5LZ65_9AGAR|nr:hypothetical protein D9615_008033 [Tricholomella constricta]